MKKVGFIILYFVLGLTGIGLIGFFFLQAQKNSEASTLAQQGQTLQAGNFLGIPGVSAGDVSSLIENF